MLKLNKWLSLKALFNPCLNDAVMAKDEEQVRKIINDQYEDERDNGFFSEEPIDFEHIITELNEVMNDEELMNRML